MARFLPRRRYHLYRGELADLARGLAREAPDDGASDRRAFESALAQYHGGDREVFAVSSGRAALLLLLDALAIPAGSEILVPAYTLRALVVMLAERGFVPVPVDLAPGSFGMDPEAAAKRLGPKTRAILATHLFGRICAIDELAALADRTGVALLEDCAQSLGARRGGRLAGTWGAGAIFSFDLLKAVNTYGGGALLAAPATIAAARRALGARATPLSGVRKKVAVALVEHAFLRGPAAGLVARGLAWPPTRQLVAGSYRRAQNAVRPAPATLAAVLARIGLQKLATADARAERRRVMMRALADALGEDAAKTVDAGENGYFFVRRAHTDAEALRRVLLRRGIDAGIGAEVADLCDDLGRGEPCSNARAAFRQAIQLPLHEGLRERDLRRIAAACAGALT